jgi:hypothetical protein
MTHLDWLILDATSDDFESLVQIMPNVREDLPHASDTEIARSVLQLLEAGLLRQLEAAAISLDDLMSSPQHPAAPYWFGMTERGADAWEQSASQFGEEPPNWNDAYACVFDFSSSRGHCDGVSRDVCLAAIRSSPDHAAVREETFRIDDIESFPAKYYKRIEGGVRVSFDLTKP